MTMFNRFFKKITGTVMSLALIGSAMPMTAMPASATTITFLQGDVNGDGSVSLSDQLILNRYFYAGYRSYGNTLTRMDVNQDKVIDKQDANMILDFYMGMETPQYITQEAFTDIHDKSEVYVYHDYENHSESNEYDSYYLKNTVDSASSTYAMSRSVSFIEYRDHENINTVQIYADGKIINSGFIVDKHVVATSASAVIADRFNFKDNIQVRVYDEEGTTITHTYEVRSAHVPQRFMQYLYHDEKAKYNMDYALLYIEEDLSEHGIWSLGYMTTEFMNTNTELYTNAFTQYAGIDARFYSKGNIVDYDVTATENTEVIKDLKFNTTAYATLIKSGGPIYYNSTYNNNTIKTVLGIFTNHGEIDYSTWGVRITPTLARFYLSNPNIEPVE